MIFSSRVHVLAELYNLLHRSDNGDRVPLDEYIERIVDSVRMFASRIKILPELQDVDISSRAGSVIGLILIELLTNCVKYAFPPRSGWGCADSA